MLALVGRKEMHNHVAVIEQEPAIPGLSLHAAFFLVIFLCRFQHGFGKRVQHAVAGAVADDEIIGKRCDVLDVEQQDVFALFVLKGVDDFMREFECVQWSPLKVCNNDLSRYYFRYYFF